MVQLLQPLAVAQQRFSATAASVTAATPKQPAEMHDLDGAAPSPKTLATLKAPTDLRLPHSSYTREQLETQKSGQHHPQGLVERSAYGCVWTLRQAFDLFTGYSWAKQDENLMLNRVLFLETIAGVPGMVGAMNRHLKSLRRMERDYGWIHTLLEEAENERMHLMTTILLKKPGLLMRLAIAGAQGIFFAWYATMYALSPRFCHRFVGYLEEEAFKTYTNIVHKIDQGKLPGFQDPAPVSAIRYWNMEEDTTLREVFLAIRADENHHRIVNHAFAEMHHSQCNPFPPGF